MTDSLDVETVFIIQANKTLRHAGDQGFSQRWSAPPPKSSTKEASAQVQGEVDQSQYRPAVLGRNGPANMEKDAQGQIASQSHTHPSLWAEGGLAGTPKGPGNSWDLCWKFLAYHSCNLLVQLERCIFELQKATQKTTLNPGPPFPA